MWMNDYNALYNNSFTDDIEQQLLGLRCTSLEPFDCCQGRRTSRFLSPSTCFQTLHWVFFSGGVFCKDTSCPALNCESVFRVCHYNRQGDNGT